MNTLNFADPELIKCFFSQCERKFRFLEQKHEFSYISGLAEYKNAYKIIKPYQGQKTPSPFLAMTRYEKENQTLEILYGGADFMLEVYSCHGHILRFTPAEILMAARKSSAYLPNTRGLSHSAAIEDALENLSKALRKHVKTLLNPSQRLLDRAQTIHNKQLEQAVRKRHRNTIEDACRQAAKAYREKDYPKVIQILEPHKNALGKADLKKLYLAKSLLRP
ncbi:MAG: hypothetical protein IT559_01985 [Alphaproteobacteria bacterium]|nr:hypothetical protein [Alphaproteobacteria bacterium]